ncbi:hypothetical protein Tco_0700625, partial [Tanacetum coccineum]
ENERENDKSYAELEKKCNDALQDLDKNPLVLDMRAKIETLCTTFEEVAALKEPFDLEKIPGYRSSFKKRFNQVGDDLATTFYPFIAEATARVPLWKSCSRRSQRTFNDMGISGMLRIFELVPLRHYASKASPTHRNHGDRYCFIMGCIASKSPLNWFATNWESTKPANNASYSASLLVVSNSNLRASKTVFTFEGFALIPFLMMRCPRNGLFSTPKEHFPGLSFMLNFRRFSNVS